MSEPASRPREPPEAADGPAAVRLHGLTRRFGERTAVANLSFAVAPGELFGLVGPDGAGKTTTLRMLAGVLTPSAGDAEVAGVSVRRDPEGVKRAIAYMSQRFGLYTDLTVMENLRFYADLYRVPRGERAARLERLFAFSNLAPFADRLAGQLSGGMKQKLGLSCALVHQPEVLLLDEPTFGVDPISRRELWRIVHEMVAEGVTALVATAYLDEAERFDRVALLDAGRLLALDTPRALQGSLVEEVVEVRVEEPRRAQQALVAAGVATRATAYGGRLHVTVAPGATAAGDDADREPATPVEARDSDRSARPGPSERHGDRPGSAAASRDRAVAAVAAALHAAGLAPQSVEGVPPSLEDVFIARVSGAADAMPGVAAAALDRPEGGA